MTSGYTPGSMPEKDQPGFDQILGALRRVMCNELDQQVRQVAQRSAKGVVDPLAAGVCCDLGRQTP